MPKTGSFKAGNKPQTNPTVELYSVPGIGFIKVKKRKSLGRSNFRLEAGGKRICYESNSAGKACVCVYDNGAPTPAMTPARFARLGRYGMYRAAA